MSQLYHDQQVSLVKALEEVRNKWESNQPSNVTLTSPGHQVRFFELNGGLGEDDSYDEQMYEFLRGAYRTEYELVVAIDNVGGWFERRIEELSKKGQVYSIYQDVKTRAQAMNRVVNQFNPNQKKKQIVVCLISHELAIKNRERNVRP